MWHDGKTTLHPNTYLRSSRLPLALAHGPHPSYHAVTISPSPALLSLSPASCCARRPSTAFTFTFALAGGRGARLCAGMLPKRPVAISDRRDSRVLDVNACSDNDMGLKLAYCTYCRCMVREPHTASRVYILYWYWYRCRPLH